MTTDAVVIKTVSQILSLLGSSNLTIVLMKSMTARLLRWMTVSHVEKTLHLLTYRMVFLFMRRQLDLLCVTHLELPDLRQQVSFKKNFQNKLTLSKI